MYVFPLWMLAWMLLVVYSGNSFILCCLRQCKSYCVTFEVKFNMIWRNSKKFTCLSGVCLFEVIENK